MTTSADNAPYVKLEPCAVCATRTAMACFDGDGPVWLCSVKCARFYQRCHLDRDGAA